MITIRYSADHANEEIIECW